MDKNYLAKKKESEGIMDIKLYLRPAIIADLSWDR